MFAVQRFKSILELSVATTHLQTNKFQKVKQSVQTNPPLGDNPIGDIAIPQRVGSTDPRETAPHAKCYNEYFGLSNNQT